MTATAGAEIVAVAFAALAPDAQEQAFARISDIRLTRLAELEGETAGYIRSLRRVADCAGGVELSPNLYRHVRRELLAAGEDVVEFNGVCRYFGSWRRAKEALGLAEVTTPAKIDARFRARLLKQRPFKDEELPDALARCVNELGRIPLLSEYDEWRLREMALARTRGENARVPSASVFRRRHGSWEKALLASGYSPEEVYVRLEPPAERRSRVGKVDRYTEETLRKTLSRCVAEVGGPPTVEEFGEWRRRELKRTGADSVVLPSDSPYRRRYGNWERALLHFGYTVDTQTRGPSSGGSRSRKDAT